MIKTDRQLRHTEKEMDRFEAALKEQPKGASRDALQSVLDDMREDVADYAALKRGDLSRARSTSPYGLPEVIIRTRIARGLSQSDLAEKVGVAPQQIQRWEADDYESINAARLLEIADVLGVRLHAAAAGSFVTTNIVATNLLPFIGSLNFSTTSVFPGTGLILTQAKVAELKSPCGGLQARFHDTPTAPVIHVDDGRGQVGGVYIRVSTPQQHAAVNVDQTLSKELRVA